MAGNHGRFGSAFTGIGGFDLALERAGFQCSWQIENDKHCNQILERYWPDTRRFGDICGVRGEDLGPVDLVCGGFPCQDLSVAGRRAGLAGERSGLFWEFIRVVKELTLRPCWVLLENVPGLLSSNGGRDMGTVLGALEELGYGWAYRVLDAQYFGVAQRRRRVFIVGRPCPVNSGRRGPVKTLTEEVDGEREAWSWFLTAAAWALVPS